MVAIIPAITLGKLKELWLTNHGPICDETNQLLRSL